MPTTDAPLVERAAETAALAKALTDAARGAGSCVLVTGPAGAGRTALVEHARAAAAEQGFSVLTSRPTPVSAALPRGVLRDWVRDWARSAGKPVSELLPPPASPADLGTWSLDEIDRRLADPLERLTGDGPVLLVVDDAQWADRGSLQVLDVLSTRFQDAPVVLLLALRSGEPAALPDVVQRIRRRAVVLDPAPLTPGGIARIQESLPIDAPLAAVAPFEVHAYTGGLPFLVHELLAGSGAWPAAPPASVVEHVRCRLERLGDPTLEVGRAVALLGEEASFDALAELCGLTVAELADPLEALVRHGLATVDLWDARPVQPMVADAVLACLPRSERSRYHSRAAELLAREGRPARVVAAHLLHTLPGEDGAVVALLREAGEEALAAGATAEGAGLLLRAVAEVAPEHTDPLLIARAAAAHALAGDSRQAFTLWSRAVQRTADPVRKAELLADVARHRIARGERAAAGAAYTGADRLLADAGRAADAPERRLLAARTALTGLVAGGSTGDRDAFDEAVVTAAARPVAQDTHADRLLFALAAVDLAARGRHAHAARAHALRALGRGRLVAEDGPDGTGVLRSAMVLTWCDAHPEALSVLDASVEQCRARGSVLGLATARAVRGHARFRAGDLHGAVADLEVALDSRRLGWSEQPALTLATLAGAYAALGRTEPLQRLERPLRDLAGDHGPASSFARVAAGLVRSVAGDADAALADFRAAAAARDVEADPEAWPVPLDWREHATRALQRLGRDREARSLAGEAVAAARRWGAPGSVASALAVLAGTAPREEGETLLREALQLAETAGAAQLLARVRLQLGELLLRSRTSQPEGRALVDLALERGRTDDVPPLVREASRALLRHGLAVPDVTGSPLAMLTPGERRVTELAVRGRSNRAIAQELVVTVKAVEWHLSNAYRKLGISSRAQLLEALAAHPPAGEPASSSDR